MTPATTTVSPSQMASTSTSVARLRYWSIRTGESPDTCTACGDVAGQLLVVAHDLHGPAAEHIGGADHHRVADLMSGGLRLFGRAGDSVDRLADTDLLHQLLEALTVFGQVDGVRGGAEDRHARSLQSAGEL